MKKFIVTMLFISGFVAMAASSAEARPHFGRIAFAKHQSPSTMHYRSVGCAGLSNRI